ncbi:MAG TPA: response regulator [Capillimicrobium sp.]|nr:response regulator [Capillimicrobium sp.]
MRILVSGESKLVRQGVAMILESVDGYEVEQVPELSRARARLRFRGAHVLVLDLDPYASGLAALRELAGEGVATPIVALLTSATRAHVSGALSAGATICLAKEAVAEELVAAVELACVPPSAAAV